MSKRGNTMSKGTFLGLILLLAGHQCLLAQSPVGTLGGKGMVRLSGNLVSLTSLSSLPLVSGDVVGTTGESAIIQLKDRSRLLVEKNSKVKVEGSGDKFSIYLLEGSLSYRLIPSSQTRIFAQNQAVNSALQSVGSVTLSSGAVVSSPKASPQIHAIAAAPEPAKKASPKECKDKPCDKNCGKGNDDKCS